jgi:hypothetical protein
MMRLLSRSCQNAARSVSACSRAWALRASSSVLATCSASGAGAARSQERSSSSPRKTKTVSPASTCPGQTMVWAASSAAETSVVLVG